jgi:hypothetical protein
MDIWDIVWTFCVPLEYFFPVLVKSTKKNLSALVLTGKSAFRQDSFPRGGQVFPKVITQSIAEFAATVDKDGNVN